MPQKLDDIDLNRRWQTEADYRDNLKSLQSTLSDLQNATFHNHHQIVIVVEGWDASGKGGAIRRITQTLDPRSYRVHAIGKPDDRESKEHYLQRFWRRLPPKGHIAIFDRSWYGRVLVERVEGIASKAEWTRAYGEINEFETTLTQSGVVLIKLLLHISQDEQLRRYTERLNNPRKNWKLTGEDLRNRERAPDYHTAYDDMLDNTCRDNAPWAVIPAEHKWYARTAVLECVCHAITSAIDTRIPQLSAEQIAQTKKALGISEER
jgi:polyphosphate kinase 2 (PPK2 family)